MLPVDKQLNKVTAGDLRKLHGQDVRLKTEHGIICTGQISIERDNVYVVHNNENARGGAPRDERNMFGFRYSWCIYESHFSNNETSNTCFEWINIINRTETKGKVKKPKRSFLQMIKGEDLMINSVILEESKKQQIYEALAQSENRDKIFNDWGFADVMEKGTAISMLFYGAPGTGKTMMCDAIAEVAGKPLLKITSAEIETSTPGGAERNIKKYFGVASGEIERETGVDKDGQPTLDEKKEYVLLFDECDSLLSDRKKVGMIIASQINVLLQEIETFNGVVLFTTNRVGTLDPALESRLSVKMEFPFPDKEVREKIWQRMIPSKAPIGKCVKFDELAKLKIAGRNIKNIVLGAARQAAMRDEKEIKMEHFEIAAEREVAGIQGFEKKESIWR